MESNFDYEEHYRKIQCSAQKIRSQYGSNPSAANLCLQELFGLFCVDIEQVAGNLRCKIIELFGGTACKGRQC